MPTKLSWLNLRGKPQVAIATITVPADSPNIVESKSFKLYLNSFNQTRLAGTDALLELLRADLSAALRRAGAGRADHAGGLRASCKMGELDGLLLDRLDIEVDSYTPDAALLKAEHDEAPVEETLVSHLLKSNCLVTGQPDWASVQIRYVGPQIDQEGLLKYLIGFRKHNEFHEQCVERIFMDILRQCKPQKLAVYARYTRRGGLDINPWRSNFTTGQRPPTCAMPANRAQLSDRSSVRASDALAMKHGIRSSDIDPLDTVRTNTTQARHGEHANVMLTVTQG